MSVIWQTSIALFFLLAACISRVSGQTPVTSPRCLPEWSETSACVWTGDCSRAGCSDKCITNVAVTGSWLVLLDRSVGENFYSACPILAEWVNLALGVTRGTGRRLLSQADAVEAIKSTSMGHGAAERPEERGRAASRALLDFIAIDAASPAPSPVAGGSISADIPSNACPTPAEVEEAVPILRIYAASFRRVFEVDASGEPLPSDLDDFAWILTEPNTYQWLVAWLEDPGRVAEYISGNCAADTMTAPRAWEYGTWLSPEDRAALDSQSTMVQCVDTFGAYDEFARNLNDVELACTPPFGLNPDCFSGIGHYIVSSTACATAAARMWNITDATPLVSIAANVNNIQDACAAETTEMECLQADMPVLDTIAELHNDIPIRWPLDLPVVPVEPVEGVPLGAPGCVGDGCLDSAEVPVVAPPNVDIEPGFVVIAGGGGAQPPAPPAEGPMDASGLQTTRTEQEDYSTEGGFDVNGPAEIAQARAEVIRAAPAVAAVVAWLLT